MHNGKTYKGNNLTIINDKIYIDGELVDNAKTRPNGEKRSIKDLFWSMFSISNILQQSIVLSGDVKVSAQNSTITINGDLTINNEDGLTGCDVSCNDLKAETVVCNDINSDNFTAKGVQCNEVNADDFTANSIYVKGDLNCDDIKATSIEVGKDLNCDDIETTTISVTGDVNCDDIRGNVNCSGDVTADTIKR